MSDLIDLIAINRRYELEDGLERDLTARRKARPDAKQAYRTRANREHRVRMDGLVEFEGERK
jgi:hypothetical protein